MKTKATSEFPEIEWADAKTDLIGEDLEEREKVYIATGLDNEGGMYVAISVFVCDEFECIKDIEKVNNNNK